MKSTTTKILAIAAAVLLCAGICVHLLRGDATNESTATPEPPAGNGVITALGDGTRGAAAPEHSFELTETADGEPGELVKATASAEFAARIEEVFNKISSGELTPGQVLELLENLRGALREEDPSEAALAIIAFLNSGRDAETGLGFLVGQGGILEESPTMRVALLDLLGESDLLEAADYSVQVFAEARSADEWALALRNVARTDIEGSQSERLATRFDEMLNMEDWLNAPSAGFLEALDVAVALGGRDQFANLASILDISEGTGLDRAAFIAIDRVAVRDPGMVLDLLARQADLLDWAPVKRATIMARADVTDPAQRAALEAYLARTDLGESERQIFGDLFPLRSYTDGHRLVSMSEDTGQIDPRANDLAALEQVKVWQAGGEFESAREMIDRARQRLDEFAEQIRQDALEPEPVMDPAGSAPIEESTQLIPAGPEPELGLALDAPETPQIP